MEPLASAAGAGGGRSSQDEAPLSWPEILCWLVLYAALGAATLIVLRRAVLALVPVWLPAGIGMGLQMRSRPNQRLALFALIFVVEFTVELAVGVYPSVELHFAYALSVAIEAWLCGELARRFNGGRTVRLDDLRGLGAMLLAGVAATFVGGLLAALVEVRIFPETYLEAIATWMQADLLGVIVLAPFLLLPRHDRDHLFRGSRANAVVLVALLLATSTGLFGRPVAPNSPLIALNFLLFPVLIWAGLMFGVVGAAAGSVILSITIGTFTEMGLGPIAALGYEPFVRQLISQGFVGLLSVSALTIGVLTRERRRATRRLELTVTEAQDAATRLRVLFEGIDEQLAVVDRNGVLVMANRRWVLETEAMTGCAPQIGEHIDVANRTMAGFGPKASALWRQALAGEPGTVPWPPPGLPTARGEYELTIAPIREPTGDVVGAYMTGRDVAAWRSRQQSEARARRLETVGRLAGGVAHDFNNIVTGILGYAELARVDLPEGHSARADLEEISKAGERAGALTKQLLAYARRQVIEPRRVALPELLDGLRSLLQRVIGEDVALDVQVPHAIWPVRADPGQLEQVVMNLAVNARDAMPHGGRLTLECANAHVDGRSAGTRDLAPGDYAVLAVSDSGVGMTPDVLERIFEPFYTTKGAGKGTGLGLATVDGIARQFGGVVTAYSEPGIGSTFKLYLPRDTAPAEAAPDPVSATARDHGNELILLVEDDVTLRTLNARILTERGFRVQAFEDGHRALEVADDVLSGASMLLTDVVLPSINGREVAERLHRRAPHLKVLFVSGYTEDSVLRNGILEQGMRFLAKPFGPDDLVARVRAVLDN